MIIFWIVLKYNVLKNSYSHLRNISFTDVSEKEDLTVHLLICADNLWLLQKGSTIRGEKDQPVAIETSLGWTLSGPTNQEGITSQSARVNVTITSQLEKLEEQKEIQERTNHLSHRRRKCQR